MKNVIITAFCCAVFSLLTCTAVKVSHPYVLSEAYATANLSGQPLVLALPGQKDIVITNPKDVIDDYGGMNASPESRVEKFYLAEFAETVRTNISGDTLIVAGGYHPGVSFNDFEKKRTAHKIAPDTATLEYEIPTKSAMLEARLDSAVVIFVKKLTFRRNKLYMEYYWDEKTKRPANLEVNADLVVWDYKNDAPVFYGTVSEKVDFQIVLTRKHWDESARSLAKRIILSVKCL